MAQLPPKVPSMSAAHQNWADFPNQNMIINNNNNNPSWVDEFLDFSSARRSHRRSMSDSIAFLEAPMVEECRRTAAVIPRGVGGEHGNNNNNNDGAHHGTGCGDFERFDDEQLMSMFNEAVGPTMSCSNPSSPSTTDRNSFNDNMDDHQMGLNSDHLKQLQLQPKNEPTEEDQQSSCKSDESPNDHVNGTHAMHAENSPGEKIVDPKRIKRILANRQSAQRSRVRKLQYISELERSVTSLQAEVSVLSPRVAFLDHQRLVLNVDNSVLKQRIAALAQDKVFKDAHQEALKREIERLRQIYYQQNNLKKMEHATGAQPKSPSRVAADTNCNSAEKEQLAVI